VCVCMYVFFNVWLCVFVEGVCNVCVYVCMGFVMYG